MCVIIMERKGMKRVVMLFSMMFMVALSGCGNQADRQVPAEKSTLEEQIPDSEIQSEEGAALIEIQVIINNKEFAAQLYNNETTKALREQLPITFNMNELNGNEKYSDLPYALPTNAQVPSEIRIGDIMLYGSDCLVLFYKGFSTSYSYTPLGSVYESAGLAETLGDGNVTVTFQEK